MFAKWTVFFCVYTKTLLFVLSENDGESAYIKRQHLLQRELDMMLGSDIVLSDSELKANEIIMKMKLKELDYGFKNPQFFNYSKHFFEYKDEIKDRSLFKLIKQMPKGAILHVHDTGILDADYVLKLTYWDNLFICFGESNVNFLFSIEVPDGFCESKWQLVKDVRYNSEYVEQFDNELRKLFTLVIDNPREVYSDINAVWTKFQNYFLITAGLFTYKPVWEQYLYDALKVVREDNIMYLELRSVLSPLYDLQGNEYDLIATAMCSMKILDKFSADYPDFFGAKLIYAPVRMVGNKTLEEYINTAIKIKVKMPNYFAGFDLVGQEDSGTPTKHFLPILMEASNEINYFFHAGETNWYGMAPDENLGDAIVLGSKRIGHGYALLKHPVLIDNIKKNDIALEVNVISNNVLKLVEDMRNHPLASFLAQSLPVVISSDDPGLWDAEPLSHDFYVTFLGVASRHADLRLLKKLALNSLHYSTISDKDEIVNEFNIRWTKFIDNIVMGTK